MSFCKKSGIFRFQSATDIQLEDLDIEAINRMAEKYFNP